MQYVLLIYSDPVREQAMTPAEGMEEMAAYGRFTGELVQSGAMRGGEALEGATAATTVRVRDGKVITTDGPFAETREVLGGYYVVDVDNIDDAIAWAAKIPGAANGSIEVRPVMVLPEEYQHMMQATAAVH